MRLSRGSRPSKLRGRSRLATRHWPAVWHSQRVVDRYNRAHDVPNLFMVDGGSLVTSGLGQPTMTIMALAFRAADHLVKTARAGNV